MKVEELAERIIDYRGKTPPKTSEGVPLITAKVIKGGRILQTGEYISEETYTSWMRRGLPQQWDLLVTTEAPLGEVALLRTPERIALAQRVILLRGRAALVDQRYLSYAFQSPLVQERLRARATGTTVSGIKQSELRQVDVPLPPIRVQRKIAAVLAAHDELIENNLRRIEILEEMAQAIYQEWFVNFRYPGHEADDLLDSPFGPVPEEWAVRNLFDVADVTYGFGFKSALFNDGPRGERVIRIRDIPKNTSSTFTSEEAHEKYRVLDGDVLVGMDGDFHMCVWRDGPAVLNQRVVRFRPSTNAPVLWLFHALLPSIRHFNATITGTTVAHLGDRHLRTVELVVPPPSLLASTREVLDPLEKLIGNLARQNANLRATRDLLLPKLISGEIDVSSLDIDTSWLAA